MHARPCRAHAYFHARMDGAVAVIMRQTQTPHTSSSSSSSSPSSLPTFECSS